MLYHALERDSPDAYLVQVCCRLVGELDAAAFAAAWQLVFQANPALRTVLRWSGQQHPRQLFPPGLRMPIEVVDHSGLALDELQAAFARLAEADRRLGFDLERGPLIRLTLVAEGPAAHRCVLTHHHLVLDGWSQQLLLGDVFDCYQQLKTGMPATCRSRPPYRDYLDWLADLPGVDETYWRSLLGGVSPTHVAPVGCRSAEPPAGPRSQAERRLSGPLIRSLVEFTRKHGVTPGAIVHGGWALLLGIQVDRDDVVFGSTVSGRPPQLPGAMECVGLFVNTLPVRVVVRPDASAVDWLREIQQDLVVLRENQHLTLGAIERAVGRPGGVGLFDTLVVVENFPAWLREGDEIAGLRIEELATVVEESYPLVVEFAPGAEPVLRMRYDRRQLDSPTVHSGLDALVAYLECVLADPQCRLDALRDRIAARWRTDLDANRRTARSQAESALGTVSRRPVDAVPPTGHDIDRRPMSERA